ncbi:hypothetical protein RJ639_029975 [Escallonia herrerae]|uniref:Uncharacterized protein n=1 Tax=Escallonia herrerae TaxID=1293975 RepID=A0AA88WZN1_9ASTE|nr:hypothetical protein RJ639_029975 [Escallonia herrerae]
MGHSCNSGANLEAARLGRVQRCASRGVLVGQCGRPRYVLRWHGYWFKICELYLLQAPFGYSRKDVMLIGVGVPIAGIGLKSGLEFYGVDPLQAGNVVQLVLVLGLTIGWISTYIFRVSNKEMTYAQQLRDYENKVMQKRLDGLTEAELEALLEQVEEDKRCLASGEKVN